MATDVVVLVGVAVVGEMALTKEPVVIGLVEEQTEAEVKVL